MAKEQEKYVSKITLRTPKKTFIAAGTIFEASELNKGTFDALQAAGTVVTEEVFRGIKTIPVPRNLVSGLSVPEVKLPEPVKNTKKQVKGGNTKKEKASTIWNYNPEELQSQPFEVLLSIYQELCEQYQIISEKFGTKEEVVVKLSSQFVK